MNKYRTEPIPVRVAVDDRKRVILVDLSQNLDAVVHRQTAFGTLQQLLDAPGYRPSLYLSGKSRSDQEDTLTIAVRYDLAQAARGDDRRCFKGDWRYA